MFLLALRKQYEADVAEATAVIDTFLQKAVGVYESTVVNDDEELWGAPSTRIIVANL